jgi:hypothetical protein
MVYDPMQIRKDIYKELTSHLDNHKREILLKLTGRNIELAFISFDVAALLGMGIEGFEDVITEKEEHEGLSESYYLESLEDFLAKKFAAINESEVVQKSKEYIKKDGLHASCPFYPKNLVYQEWLQELKAHNISTVGTKLFNSLLRDLQFIQGDSLLSVRTGSYPKPCLIFSTEIQERLHLKDKPKCASSGCQIAPYTLALDGISYYCKNHAPPGAMPIHGIQEEEIEEKEKENEKPNPPVFETYLPCSFLDPNKTRCSKSPCAKASDGNFYCERHLPADAVPVEEVNE